MILTRELLNSFKSFKLLETYFTDLYSVDHNHVLVRQIWFLYLSLFYYCVKCLLVFSVPMSLFIKSIMIEATGLYRMPRVISWTEILVMVMVYLFLDLLYFQNKIALTNIIRKVVIEQNDQFFLFGTFKNRPVHEFVRKAAKTSLLINQQFIFAIGLLF